MESECGFVYEVSWNRADEIIKFRWNSASADIDDEAYRETADVLLSAVELHRAKGLLLDVRELKYTPTAAFGKWIQMRSAARIAKAGLDKIAWVVEWRQASLDIGCQVCDVKRFASKPRALQWLCGGSLTSMYE